MGRGRAKAKQTKVARELKYGGPQTDFDRLQAELGTGGGTTASRASRWTPTYDVVEDPYADDPYAKYYDEDDDEESAAR